MNDNKGNTFSEIHKCFSLSRFLKYQKVELNIKDPIRLMPKVVNKDVNSKTVEEIYYSVYDNPWEHTIIETDWPKLKTVFFNEFCFVHPAPRSLASDLFFSIPPNKVICFAIKNNPKEQLNFDILQEEIDKASFMTQSKAENLFDFVTLFVICNGIQNSTINKFCTEEDCLVFREGAYSTTDECIERLYDFQPNFNILNHNPYDKKILFIPKNMEVIVLGKHSISSFFTKEDINQLSILLNQTYPNVDYLKNFIPFSLDFVSKVF